MSSHEDVNRDAESGSRTMWMCAIAATVVGALAVVAWFVWGNELHSSTDQSQLTASPSTTASPSASLSGEPGDLAFPAPLPADGFFLDAAQLTVDVWADVTDGWTLTYWEPSRQAYGDAGVDVTDPDVAAIYLMSPHGKRYEVGHFEAAEGTNVAQIAWWEPDALEAIVRVWSDAGAEWRWLNLTDGHLAPVGGLTADSSLVGWTADGRLILQDGDSIIAIARDASREPLIEHGAGAQLSPDGTVLATFAVDDAGGPQPVTAYSASTGEELWAFDAQSLATGDQVCIPGGWAAPDEPAVVCQSWGGTDVDYSVGAASFYALSASGAVNFYTTDDTFAWDSPQVAADGVVATASDPNAQGIGQLYYLDENSSGPLVAPAGHGDFPRMQTLAKVDITRWFSEHEYSSTTARDVSTGAAFDVTPPLQADDEWWWTTRQAVFLVGGIGGAS